MKILAMDIGAGTQDILLYDSGRTLENCLKMILPSPSSLYSIKIAGVAEDLFLYDRQVGGSRLSKIIRQHLEKGYAVYMTEEVAYTIRNNLEDVISLGIKIVKEAPSGFSRLDIIAVTGPSQSIFQRTKLNYHWARLGGDTMMVGPMGLVLSARAKFQLTLGRRDFPGPLQSSRATLANHN